jgi:hypothetical protein
MADQATPILFAIITTDTKLVSNGGMAPVFIAKDEEEQHEIAMWISRITNANTHNLPNGVVMMIATQNSQSGGGGAG